jgi:proteasome assembly chaperone (PAC2) family protein
MEPGKVTFYEQPVLRQPDLVAAFIGWPDAAQVSTGAISYLVKKLPARNLAEIKSDEYYDFGTIRPTVTIENGVMEPIRMPMNSVYYWQNKSGERDLIIISGIEPQMKWQSFVEVIADLAGYYNVHRVYAVGGLYDRIPHSRETRISGLVNDTALVEIIEQAGVEPVNYQGPSSIHGLLLSLCATRRIPAISLWGHVPFYIRAESNPMVCLKILTIMAAFLGIDIDLNELKKSADSLHTILNKLLAENDQMRNFLQSLEEQYDIDGSGQGMEPEGSAQIIKDIEDFLSNQRQDS